MKRNILFILLVLLFSVVLPTLLAYSLPSNPSQYYNAYIKKQERWLSLDSNRIMIVGFSELAFGVDSKMIQDSTGYNVCNYALHAGLGADLICKDVKKNAKKNDVVVFAVPINMASDGTADVQSIAFLIDICPSKIFELGGGNLYKLFRGTYSLLKGKITYNVGRLLGKELIDEEYNCNNFNEYGDEEKHWGKTECYGEPIRIKCGPVDSFNEGLYKIVLETLLYLERSGVKIIIIPELLERCNYGPNKEMLSYLEKRLSEDGFHYAISPKEFLLEDDMCYLGVHANRKGVDYVTNCIINALKSSGVVK